MAHSVIPRRMDTRSKSVQRSKSSRRRSLAVEHCEDRLMLAQTTGLFFHEPEAADGYVLFSPNTSNTTFLINKDGEVVNTWQSQYLPGLLGHLQPDGSLIRAASPTGQQGNGFINAPGAGGLLERFEWDGTKTWEFWYSNSQVLAHHDFEIMPNGNILVIAWEYKTEAEATQAGRDPSLPGPGYLYPDHVIEVQPDYLNGGGTIVWQWHVWDHLVQEFDPTKDNYYGPNGVAENPQLININYVSTFSEGASPGEDWTHANGIAYNAELDQIAISVREFNEIWIIDHSTTTEEAASSSGGNSGRGGNLLYRWGNPQAYNRGDESDRAFFYQHDVRWVPDGQPGAGNLTVLNNGLGRPGVDFTSVDEITPPLLPDGNYALSPGEPWGPAAPSWTYAGPVENFAAIISGAKRLENGNTLITYGTRGNMTEVTPAGDEVWKYVNPFAGAVMLGPEDPIPPLGVADPLLGTLYVNFVFQAQHYPHGYLNQLTSNVADRQLFYNNSVFDGFTPAATPQDDLAIAIDKSAYLGGGLSSFGNVSSYVHGINGLMIDLSGAVGNITASDFTFRMGTNNSPSEWLEAPAPAQVIVRPGAGQNGSNRVQLVWEDGAIKNTWLQVTIAANSRTGLTAADTFYFGSRVGDTGEGGPPHVALTNVSDEISVRTNGAAGQGVTNPRDFNRDGLVNAADEIIARLNFGFLPMLFLMDEVTPQAAADVQQRFALAAYVASPILAAHDPATDRTARRTADDLIVRDSRDEDAMNTTTKLSLDRHLVDQVWQLAVDADAEKLGLLSVESL